MKEFTEYESYETRACNRAKKLLSASQGYWECCKIFSAMSISSHCRFYSSPFDSFM